MEIKVLNHHRTLINPPEFEPSNRTQRISVDDYCTYPIYVPTKSADCPAMLTYQRVQARAQ